MTADQIAEAAPDSMLTRVRIFQVACPATDTPAAEQERGLPALPSMAGRNIPRPDRVLQSRSESTRRRRAEGIRRRLPKAILSVADQRRWFAFTANHDWTAYPQAGEGCVDP